MASIKQKMTRIIREQPDDSSYEEILQELAFARMIERGLADLKSRKTITHKRMKNKILLWQK